MLQAYPYPTQDMLSIIADKGQESDHIFEILLKESHWSLRCRLDSDNTLTGMKNTCL